MQALSDMRAAFNVIKRYRSIYPHGRLQRVLQGTDFGPMLTNKNIEEDEDENGDSISSQSLSDDGL